MKKILVLAVVAVALGACREESLGDKIERKVRNAGDKIEDAADELK
jgi:hypothetical protein